jgi:hypothetical protein
MVPGIEIQGKASLRAWLKCQGTNYHEDGALQLGRFDGVDGIGACRYVDFEKKDVSSVHLDNSFDSFEIRLLDNSEFEARVSHVVPSCRDIHGVDVH